ncbi:MAG: hypothetical protein ABJC55_12690, partial [Algoriphagus sp.]
MATLRQQALSLVQTRQRIPSKVPPSTKISDYFGVNTFGTAQMKVSLAPSAYKRVMEAIDKGTK